MSTLAEHDAATRHSDGLWHTDDCLLAQDVGPCTCGRAEADRAADRAWREARPLVVAALEAAAVVCDPMVEGGGGDRWWKAHADLRAALDALREKGLL